MIPLKINEWMIHQLRANGYLHLHNGEIRLALTLHGRKGLPVVTRVALLDTRFWEYQNACIATLQATLNVGTMCVTLFSNLKVALKDPPNLPKYENPVANPGAPQIGNTYASTFHHKMAYWVQNHAMDLSLSRDTEDGILIQLKSQHNLPCIYIPGKSLETSLSSYFKSHGLQIMGRSMKPVCQFNWWTLPSIEEKTEPSK